MWATRGKVPVAMQQFGDIGAMPGTEFGVDDPAARKQIVSTSLALARYRKDGREFIRRPSAVNPQSFNPTT
jgi:hypothetical protein